MTTNQVIYEVTSNNSLSITQSKLEESLGIIKFGVLAKLNLGDKMRSKGINYENELIAYEVCNPVHANNILLLDDQLRYILPCKITIQSRNGEITVGMLNFLNFDNILNNETRIIAEQIMTQLIDAINESCG